MCNFITVLILVASFALDSQQSILDIKDNEEILVFSRFLREFCSYSNSYEVNFIVEKFSDEYEVNILTVLTKKMNWAISRIYINCSHETLVKTFMNHRSVALIFSQSDEFTTHLVDQMSDENTLLNYVSWLIMPRDYSSYRRLNINPSFRLFTIAFIKEDLFMIAEKTGNNSWILKHQIGEIFTEISTTLGLRYKNVYREPNDSYGGIDGNNTPTGLFKELDEKRADIAVAPVSHTLDRAKIADMTLGYLKNYVGGVYKIQPRRKTILSFYQNPFSNGSWILIITSSITIFVTVSLAFKLTSNSLIRDSLLDMWGALLSQGTYDGNSCQRTSWKCIFLVISMLGVLLTTFYSSKLVAHNAVNSRTGKLHDFYDVADAQDYYPFIWANAAMDEFLQDSNDEEITQIWNRIRTRIAKHTMSDFKVTLKNIKESGVYIGFRPHLLYLCKMDPNLAVVDRKYFHHSIVFALQKNSPLTRVFNNVIMDMKQSGIISKIIAWYEPSQMEYEEQEPKQIAFIDFALLMIILFSGIVISLLILAVECKLNNITSGSFQT